MPIHRKTIRLNRSNYVGLRRYFVTMCCARRAQIFVNPAIVARAIEILNGSSAQFGFAVRAYCFMPDHAHVLAEGLEATSSLLDFIHDFKQRTAFEFGRDATGPLWQFKYYDYILRNRDSQESVAWYIWMNPVRKGLVNDPWDYPFSGSFTFNWKDRLRPPEAWSPSWKKQKQELPSSKCGVTQAKSKD
ncbi:MAG TPA: transposase [Candidatus Acidoferrales bacterium]|nr:transposase [Candidatus Acidoferrales bacterium]